MSNGNNNNLFDSISTSIANKVNSIPIWKKQLQMILISGYVALSCFVTIANHSINFNKNMPLKLIDILVIMVMSFLLVVNLLFIYGCYTSNRVLLYLTPAIPNFILIFVIFPQCHAFFYPLILFLKYNGLGESGLNKFLNNLGGLTMLRVVYYIPILLYTRFLFNGYTDDFIEELQNEKEMQAEEAEEARKQAELEAEKAAQIETEKKEDDNASEVDPEAKKNN
ncbi:hypothetical protein U3516DRAFT_836370 [Neocallimastix sp. 'constans']|jgi:hypothetical protein